MIRQNLNNTLDEFLKEDIFPFLKGNGYKKMGSTWHKKERNHYQVINFQKSRFDPNRFTLNLGIFFPNVWEIVWDKKSKPSQIKTEDSFPNVRIGQLLDGFSKKAKDIWWSYSPNTDKLSLKNELLKALELSCKFLNAVNSPQKIIDWFNASEIVIFPISKIYLAVIYYLSGDKEQGETLLETLAKKSTDWEDRVGIIKSNIEKTI